MSLLTHIINLFFYLDARSYTLAMTSLLSSATESMALESLITKLKNKRNIWILSGAGISAPSGIPTYRDHKGQWKSANPIQHMQGQMPAIRRLLSYKKTVEFHKL